ncbi:MAG: tRNA (adenosine(37)-N6)-threonylcarbamoyltransferase complex transferase subunit TsaD [bacterium]|nr:tRNA (adenosine(37)-N6)-threonylcarbamoyltransferase complex transferase subunit TsaD [bacterium]
MYAAIETSFDESALAICDIDGSTVAALLSSQVELHAPYGGCVPELAARTHLSNLPQLWHELPKELTAQVTHFGVTAGPGLPGCLLAGVNFARGVAAAKQVPLHGLNHLAGHLFSPFMPDTDPAIPFPHIGLLVSGGHTELFLVHSLTRIELLGQTRDDSVGELLDKVSAMMGYGYPGGSRMEQLARSHSAINEEGRSDRLFGLPIPMRDSHDFDFSFSGLKTAVSRKARGADGAVTLAAERHPALLANLFDVILESLWIKVQAALERHPVGLVTVSGGVAINGFLRERFAAEGRRAGVDLRFPARQHCLDNAEMMAFLLKLSVEAGIEPQSFDAKSNWLPGS